MKQMAQYQRTELTKFGPRMVLTRRSQQPRPRLINPETRTWYVWDNNKQDYVDSGILIVNPNENK